jgi:pepF/M3 family oligoendopeptidase
MQSLGHEIEELDQLQAVERFGQLMQKIQKIDLRLRECEAFIGCLQAQNTQDEKANQLRAEFADLEARFQLFYNQFDAWLCELKEGVFEKLLNLPECAGVEFVMRERRERAAGKLAKEQEDTITNLEVDGYHAWGDLYPLLVSEVKVAFEGKELSFGQAENRLSEQDRAVRKEIFYGLQKKWKEKGEIFAQVLNHLAGFRLEVYAKRGWDEVLREPLFENRMAKETLDAMWSAVQEYKKPLVEFLKRKADLLGVERLSWYDLETPLFEQKAEKISYGKGAEWIIESFEAIHPPMGEFARRALMDKWIEAEDRAGKRPGGFCTAFPKSRQSRIFMTYSGTIVNLSTLTHELGHAYHTAKVDELPSLAQHYRMNVAETASTFAEQVLSDAMLARAEGEEERLKILSDRIQRSVVFMMNIHARFLFETRFYEERKQKFVSQARLCALMQEAQEEAYCGVLEEWHPYFWAAKMHFYFTGVPFYNFPYTFGYLFSLGIYQRAKREGAPFLERYDALLKESGMMSVEDLAKKHLGVDLAGPEFWRDAASAAVEDVEAFIQLAARA